MRSPAALPLALLFTLAAFAGERYVPIAVGTELQLTNASPQRTSVTIESLGGKTVRLDVDAGETIRWTARGSDGALRIEGDVDVTAVSRRAGVRTQLPVVSSRDVAEEADIPQRAPWRSGVLAINPTGGTAFVTIDDTLHAIEPRGMLRVDGASIVRARTPLLLFVSDANDANGARVFTPIAPHAQMRRRRAVRSVTPPPVTTQTVVLTPVKDNTLFQSTPGEISNGEGVHVFTGRTRTGLTRRALLEFDVAGQIPPGSRITRAVLAMQVSASRSGAQNTTLHRVTRDWGEGESNAGFGGDGGGADAESGDATWAHTFFPNQMWTNLGGDFESAADATTSVATQTPTWESAAMIARVQQWLDQPATNFGWMVRGNESGIGTAKRFDSREIQSAATRPSLTIEFEP